MTKYICEISACSLVYYKEICYDARSHERKKSAMCVAPNVFVILLICNIETFLLSCFFLYKYRSLILQHCVCVWQDWYVLKANCGEISANLSQHAWRILAWLNMVPKETKWKVGYQLVFKNPSR